MAEQVPSIDCQNVTYAERLLAEYARDASQVPTPWREFLDQIPDAQRNGIDTQFAALHRSSVFNPPPSVAVNKCADGAGLQDRVHQLVHTYRVRGHLMANLDPLDFIPRESGGEFDLQRYGLSESDLERTVSTVNVGGPDVQTLRELIARLRDTYCRYIGVQFMHIGDPEIRNWLAQRMERTRNRVHVAREEQLRILKRLTNAVIFEEFVRKKYIGAKTFSLEGSESLIPLLDLAIEQAATRGVREIVIGMAHRGRLNVLANIIRKPLREIFWEFEDSDPLRHRGSGDVKYHLGHSGNWQTAGGKDVHLSLCFNPSHVEYVNPVAQGRMRAKQDQALDEQRRCGMVILIHGDASFAGEGIVQEALNMSGLPGYTIHGTLHVIVNNQIGFTTSPDEGRSTVYPTDVAGMLQVPIFHVNGEEPESVAQVVTLAMEFRERFRRDVVIDMYGYRRWGHNEGDEPSFTQPLLYQAIEHRESVRDGYLKHLLELEGVTREEADTISQNHREQLQREFDRAREDGYDPQPETMKGIWSDFQGGQEPDDEWDTSVSQEVLRDLLLKVTETPQGFHLHRKLKRSVQQRRQMAAGEAPLDWSAAEALAIATLAVKGHRVRMSGQDAERGTFSQRHAVLHDVVDGTTHSIFGNLSDEQAAVEILNSPLCEAGVLGFEYGYSLDFPQALVAWEAQFGDFANSGQVIIDQFIASAEDKWRRLSGLVLLLPHGFEGQGPEHSSARLERFLGLCAEDNIQVACPTTPAQYFHLLRRQVKRRWRKPLIVMTPKSLLRHPRVVSSLEDLSADGFHRVLPDTRRQPRETTRIVLCSGKIYYDLTKYREDQSRSDVAILRVEQFYPLSNATIRRSLERYDEQLPVVWAQEEPINMGAWPLWRWRFGERLPTGHALSVMARPASASPATGSKAAHSREQQELVERVFQASPSVAMNTHSE